jgi:hypothetical protein
MSKQHTSVNINVIEEDTNQISGKGSGATGAAIVVIVVVTVAHA